MVTRRDISPGYQAVQAGHAAIQFQMEHPDIAKSWYNESNYLAFLSVEDENDLHILSQKCINKGINISVFREPDIGNQITAIAIEPCDKAKKICSKLPLLLQEYGHVAQVVEPWSLKPCDEGENLQRGFEPHRDHQYKPKKI